MGKVPTYFIERSKSQVNTKYLFKKKGYNVAQHKGTTMDDTEDDVQVTNTNSKSQKKQKPLQQQSVPQESFAAPSTYEHREALREKLRAKIAESRTNKDVNDPKLDKLYEERKQEKKKKKEAQKNQKHHQKQKTRADDKVVQPTKKTKSQPTTVSDDHHSDDSKIVQLDQPIAQSQEVVIKQSKSSKKSSMKDDDSDIKLDLSFAPVIKGFQEKSFDKAGTVSHKKGNKERQLQELKEFDSKLESLRNEGKSDEADKIFREKKLEAALLRAAGEIVKDDADMLSKSIKRKEAKKELSRKKWGQRIREQERQQKTRQDLRSLHISKKIEHKKDKKRRVD